MSDLSATDELFEVREAGEGRGLGCFATRDIKPGEVVLVTSTTIHWAESENWATRAWKIIDLYKALDDDDQKEWASLHGLYKPEMVRIYRKALREQNPDGSYFSEEEQEEFLRLLLAIDTNCFATEGSNESALFPRASRFNHSCDPNMLYESSVEGYSWTGTAVRDVAKGEELLISYMPNHSRKKDREREARENWGFTCDCPRCTGGLDTYTASLIQARDTANAVESERTEPPLVFVDNVEGMAERLKLRTELLGEIVELEGDPSVSRRKQLTYALYDAAVFHQEYVRYYMQPNSEDGGDGHERRGMLKGIEHLALEIEYTDEAVKWARTVWPETNEMVRMLAMDAWKAKRKWRDLREDLGVEDEAQDDGAGSSYAE
ncbi:hypothetical protein F4824DRAFT_497140 [Ustulina deusta]|nr:hypothetical protein F4824DRAFT_497140 [Ustulina deusta]